MGDEVTWFVKNHGRVWKAWLAKRQLREQRLLTAIYDVQMGIEWIAVTVDDLAADRDLRHHLGDLQAHAVAVSATLERLSILVKATRRVRGISPETENELLDLIEQRDRWSGVANLRHQAAHSSSRPDAWLKAIENEGLWELLAIMAAQNPRLQIEPVRWFFDHPPESYSELNEGAQRRLDAISSLSNAVFTRLLSEIRLPLG